MSQKLGIVVLALGAALYIWTLTFGMRTGNDGSHFAIVRALDVGGTPLLDEVSGPWAESDDAWVGEKRFSNKFPGTGFLYFGVLSVFKPLAPLFFPYQFSTQTQKRLIDKSDEARIVIMMFFQGILAIVFFLSTYGFLASSGFGLPISLSVPLLFILGTLHLRYFPVMYSHALTSTLVAVALLAAVRKWAFWGSLCLSYAVVCEPMVVSLILPFGIYLWCDTEFRKQGTKALSLLMCGGVGPLLLLAWYNWYCFGSPFTLSYTKSIAFPYHQELRTTFEFTQAPSRFLEFLLGSERVVGFLGRAAGNVEAGIFQMSPFLWVAIPGFILGVCDREVGVRRLNWLSIACFLFGLSFVSCFYAFDGGADHDYRYSLFAIQFLIFPCAFFVYKAMKFKWRIPLFIGLYYFLVAPATSRAFSRYKRLNDPDFQWASSNYVFALKAGVIIALCILAFAIGQRFYKKYSR